MSDLRAYITELAQKEGFASIGFSKAQSLQREIPLLESWLKEGRQGKMSYLERYGDLRTDPAKLHPGTRTVISLAFNYYQDNPTLRSGPRIATYALGKDYHKVLKKKLKSLARKIKESVAPEANIRFFTDSAPILEREWARRSGLGWMGKNTMLIHPKRGSYFFLAELLIDIEIEEDIAIRDHCGTCTRCIDACPTGAIDPGGYVMDGSKCISYLTIELRDEAIGESFKDKMEGWAFGCDICQQVCPWNRFSTTHQEEDFDLLPEIGKLTPEDWKNMDQEKFDLLFAQSPIRRTGLKGMQRNVTFLE